MKLLVTFIFLCSVSAIGANPVWTKNSFVTKGIILMPYGDIEEPFEAWIDTSTQRSRIDYYQGMNSIIFLDGPGYKIVPKPPGSPTQEGDMICYNVTGGITFQNILPDISKYEMVSDTKTCKHKGSFVACTVYRYSFTQGTKVNTYEMSVYQDKIPLLYNFTGYDVLMGSHYDQYLFVYLDYSEETIPPGVFDYPARMRKCIEYPGPGVSNVELGPMADLMGGMDYDEKDKDTSLEFEKFKQKFSKNYNSDVEHERKKSNFRQTQRYIHSKNRQNLGYKLAINHLSDLDEKELKLRNGYRYSGIGESHRLKSDDLLVGSDIPDEVNWVDKGAVNPPKDQGICGSCWSFGTTGTLEGSYFLKYGKLLDLSEQSLVDCTWDQGNNGCDGGETERVGEWLKEKDENHCVVTRMEYAVAAQYNDTKNGYLMADGICHWQNTRKDVCVKIINYFVSPQGDLDALHQFSAIDGPIQVAIDASHPSFSFYSSGIYYDEACGNKPQNLDHSVLLVGYGSENGQDYWLIKNSWSTHWGDGGYVKISTKNNNCGVATDAVFFTIA